MRFSFSPMEASRVLISFFCADTSFSKSLIWSCSSFSLACSSFISSFWSSISRCIRTNFFFMIPFSPLNFRVVSLAMASFSSKDFFMFSISVSMSSSSWF